jgi:hypothetical protein
MWARIGQAKSGWRTGNLLDAGAWGAIGFDGAGTAILELIPGANMAYKGYQAYQTCTN